MKAVPALAIVAVGIAANACTGERGGGNKSVPPVAGVVADVGSPSTSTSGTVPFRVYVTGPVVPGAQLSLLNESREADLSTAFVGAQTWVQFEVTAEVGDEVTLRIEPAAGESVELRYPIQAARIFEIHDTDTTVPHVHAGEVAAVRGAGFAVVGSSSTVTFDGEPAPLVSAAPVHPGQLLFTVPLGKTPGTYDVRITTPGAFQSDPFPVELE